MALKFKARIIAIVVLIGVIVVALYYFKHRSNIEKRSQKPPAKPVVVVIATTKKVLWQDQTQSIGTISALRGVTLRAEVPGRITKIYKPSGSVASKGESLFQINPNILEAQLKANQAAFTLSEFEFLRFQKLYHQNVISLDRFNRIKSIRNIDKARIEMTKQKLALTTIHAPFDGRLGLKHVDVGDFVKAGDVISTFQSLDKFRVDFSVPEKYAFRVKPGLRVTLTSSTNTKQHFVGKVYAFNPLINPNTRMLDIRAYVHSDQLLPGMFTLVTLDFAGARPALIIPQTAIVHSLHGDYVYKVIDGKAKKAFVKTGKRRGDMIAILIGLKTGDRVVSAGQMKIHDGTEVTDKGAILPSKNKYHES